MRAAVILVAHEKILLVKHVDPITEKAWWIPPGGGLQPKDTSVVDCAIREVFEETGLRVEIRKLVYLREFIQPRASVRHLELFFLARAFDGELTIENIKGKGPDEDYIKAVRWLDREAMQRRVVFPKHLVDGFWDDLSMGFPQVRHLGVQIES